MIYELRTYTLQPGKQGEYLKLNAEVGRQIRDAFVPVLPVREPRHHGDDAEHQHHCPHNAARLRHSA